MGEDTCSERRSLRTDEVNNETHRTQFHVKQIAATFSGIYSIKTHKLKLRGREGTKADEILLSHVESWFQMYFIS